MKIKHTQMKIKFGNNKYMNVQYGLDVNTKFKLFYMHSVNRVVVAIKTPWMVYNIKRAKGKTPFHPLYIIFFNDYFPSPSFTFNI